MCALFMAQTLTFERRRPGNDYTCVTPGLAFKLCAPVTLLLKWG